MRPATYTAILFTIFIATGMDVAQPSPNWDVLSSVELLAQVGSPPTPPNSEPVTDPKPEFPADIPADAPPRGGHPIPADSVDHALLTSDDLRFFDEATKVTVAEVMASEVALKRSGNPKIQAFAKHAIENHTTVAHALKQLATRKRVSLPATLAEDDRDNIEQLSRLGATDVDHEYAKIYGTAANTKVVELFEKEAREGTDADVKAFASSNLPTLRKNLEAAKKLPVA